MTVNVSKHESRRWVIALIGSAVFIVALILFARVALDIALVLATCAGVFLVQRTAGDWLSDVLGARLGTLIFASVISVFLWFLLMTGGGQSFAEQFLTLADAHGFHTVFFQGQIIPPSSVRRLPSPGPGGSAPPSGDASEVLAPAPTETSAAAGGSDGGGARAVGATGKGATVPTEVFLQLTSSRAKVGERVVATATVRASGESVDVGSVLFTVNGLARAVPVKGGTATVDIVEMVSGRCEVRAQYRGTSKFAPASSALAVLIIE